ncbi:hypothetical protein WC5_00120 [Escherichia sp. KTE114]|nr:hypothetical protein WC5_00120 [Escherichia sp. KTE114]
MKPVMLKWNIFIRNLYIPKEHLNGKTFYTVANSATIKNSIMIPINFLLLILMMMIQMIISLTWTS